MSIKIVNLSHTYNENTPFMKKALVDINLTIEKGEFLGLIGHTGSGKSTLIQLMNAILKPTRGQIFLDGEDINADKKKLKSVREKVGLVFQYPEHQLFETTVIKDVAYGPSNLGIHKEEIEERVINALKLVGVDEDLFKKSPFELSGGQKRRVAIAGVLAMRPQILILDEPTAGLDPYGRDEILSNINEMRQILNITVILVSHNMEDIARLVERIIVMNEGRIAHEGTPSEVFKKTAELEKIGLAAPQISYLMAKLKEKGFDIDEEIFTVEAATELLYNQLINNKQVQK